MRVLGLYGLGYNAPYSVCFTLDQVMMIQLVGFERFVRI